MNTNDETPRSTFQFREIDHMAVLKKTVQHEIELKLGGEEIANLFWQLDEVEQAKFFNELWKVKGFAMQLQAVTDSKHLENEGRLVMKTIGDYAERD